MPCLLMIEWVKEKPEVNPLAALLPYIRRLRSLREWINLCRSVYPKSHLGVSAWHFWYLLFLEICTGRCISNIVAIYAKRPRLGCFPSSSIAWRCCFTKSFDVKPYRSKVKSVSVFLVFFHFHMSTACSEICYVPFYRDRSSH